MVLPTSGPLTLADIQTEFGGSNPISLSEYYAGGAYVPAGTSGTYGAVPSSGAISIQNFYGTSNVAFTPDGGTTAGTAVALSEQMQLYVSITIDCTISAVWTYTEVGTGSASIASGGSDTSITFEVSTTPFGGFKVAYFTVSATAGGTTRYWTVSLVAEDGS
jgi:hypothetical protein